MNQLSVAKKLMPRPVRRAIGGLAEQFPDPLTFRPRRYALPVTFAKRRLFGELEEHVALLGELCGARKLALDIGANIGIYAYALARLCERVVAFEPNPVVAEVIQSYRRRNLTVEMVGLSSREGSFDLHIPVVQGVPRYGCATLSNAFGAGEKCVTVPVKRLDDYEYTGLSFIKIDCEGHEEEVLRGGETTIRREKPNLLVEIEQRHIHKPIGEVFALLTAWGYAGSFLLGGAMLALERFSYAAHQEPFLGRENSPEYVNNFIFRWKGAA